MIGLSRLLLTNRTWHSHGMLLIRVCLYARFFLSSSVIWESKPKPNRFASKYTEKSENGNRNGLRNNNNRNQNHRNENGRDDRSSRKEYGSNNGSRSKDSRLNKGSRPHKTKIRFNLESGSDKTRAAVKEIITKVQSVSPSYKVKFVDPEGGKLTQKNLVDIVNSTDMEKNGFLFVDLQHDGDLPLIRVIRVQDMLKEYSDRLAALKEQELLKMGSVSAQRSVNKRLQAEKKKSATKVLTLSWSISVSDLMHQKKNEIMKRVNNGEKFLIYVGERSSLYNARRNSDTEDGVLSQLSHSSTNWNRMDEDELSLEMKKRHMILDKLQGLLEDAECKFEVSGSADARVMVNVSPKPKSNAGPEQELSHKEQKRQRKHKEKEQAKKIDEADLDSLYLFKIED